MSGASVRQVIVVALFAILGCLVVSVANNAAQTQAAAIFPSIMQSAVDLAKSTGDGATVTFSAASGTTTIALWAHRPIPGSTMEAKPRSVFYTSATVTITGEATSPALLFSSKGYASQTKWAAGGATLTADGTCPASGSISAVFARQGTSETVSIPCDAPAQSP